MSALLVYRVMTMFGHLAVTRRIMVLPGGQKVELQFLNAEVEAMLASLGYAALAEVLAG